MYRIGSPARRFSITRHLLMTASMAVLLAAHIGVGSVAAQTLPAPTDIGHLGGGSAQATAAADGYVVGSSRTSSTETHAFVWSASTNTMFDIGAQISGSGGSGATGVNSSGEVVGGSNPPDYSSTDGFYWSQATGLISLGPIYQNYNQTPLVISESGVVAGASVDGQIFRWTPTDGFTYLGLPPAGYFPVITGINSRGDIVGNSGGQAFFVAGNSTTMTVLTSPDSRPGEIVIKAINDSGIAVGYYAMAPYDSTGSGDWVYARYAFKWDSSTPPNAANIVNLGSLSTTGARWSEANGINNSGVIVGYSTVTNPPFVYDAFTYQASGPMVALQRLPGVDWHAAAGITDDGVVVGSSNSQGTIWENGVPTAFTPSFAPLYNTLFLKGHMLAGTGYDPAYSQHAWALALPSTPPPPPDTDGDGVIDALDVFPTNPSETTDTDGDGIGDNSDPFPNYVGTPLTQTLTILGGVGNVGDIAQNVEYFNPATGNWQTAYLTGWHSWGFVTGTNSWINYKPSRFSDPEVSHDRLNPSWYLYRVRITVPANAQNPKMTFSVKADNWAQVAVNGVSTGVDIEGAADQQNADAVFSQSLHSGENTITINVGDYGGDNGFNFRIDLSVQSPQPLEIVPTLAPTTTTVTFGAGPFVYTGSPFSATASTNPNGTPTIVYSGDCTNAGNTCTATATYAGDPTHLGSHATTSITIDPAPTTTTVSFSAASFVYTGSAIEATASTGATIAYSGSCTNVGTCTATATTAGDENHSSSSAGATAEITKAPTTTTVSFGAGPFVYKGSAFTATASTSPIGTPSVVYTGDCTNAGTTCTATATDDGDQNHTGSSKSASITIARAMATVAATLYDVEFDGQPHTATFTITGVNGEAGATVGTVTQNTTHTTVGTYSDVWSFAGANYVSIGATAMTNKIKDTTSPVITSASTNVPTLWPPNHRMVAITVNATVTDAVGVTSLKIINVISSEPDNGRGDGNTVGDIVITGPLSVNLRAERSGRGNGRTYTITVEARDAAGNTSVRTCTVFVPKSQGGDDRDDDDGDDDDGDDDDRDEKDKGKKDDKKGKKR